MYLSCNVGLVKELPGPLVVAQSYQRLGCVSPHLPQTDGAQDLAKVELYITSWRLKVYHN